MRYGQNSELDAFQTAAMRRLAAGSGVPQIAVEHT